MHEFQQIQSQSIRMTNENAIYVAFVITNSLDAIHFISLWIFILFIENFYATPLITVSIEQINFVSHISLILSFFAEINFLVHMSWAVD